VDIMVTLTSRSAESSVHAAAAAVIPPGAVSARLEVLGSKALVFYRFDEAECARRRTVGAAPLERIGALQTLMGLPVDEPVPLSELDAGMRAKIRKLPAGAVDTGVGQVVRRAVRPLSLDLAVVGSRAADWSSGLVRASRFAPFCARLLALSGPVPERDEVLMQAAFYGIGILEDTGAGLELALAPRSYRPQRHTPAAWCFTEELYQRLR
jgi:hypothetical protein